MKLAGAISRVSVDGLMPLTRDAVASLAQLGLLWNLSEVAPKVLDLLPIGLQIDDLNHQTLYVNQSFTTLFGYELSDISENDLWFELVYPDPAYRRSARSAWETRIGLASQSDAVLDCYERVVRCKDGSDKAVEFHIRRVGDYFVYLHIDVSSRYEMAAELRRLANTDALTGIANRRRFFEIGSELVQAGQLPLSVLTFDIDYFKAVNDGRGHAAGDHVLVDIAACCAAVLAEEHTLARLGGEEFGVLLPGCDVPEARAIAERLRSAVEHRVVSLAPEPVQVTISIGGACDRVRRTDLDGLLLRADHALYSAKRAGRNMVHFADH